MQFKSMLVGLLVGCFITGISINYYKDVYYENVMARNTLASLGTKETNFTLLKKLHEKTKSQESFETSFLFHLLIRSNSEHMQAEYKSLPDQEPLIEAKKYYKIKSEEMMMFLKSHPLLKNKASNNADNK